MPFIEDVLVDGSMRCRSSDISEGGLYISAIQAFEQGAVLDVTIPFRGDELRVRGEVRHHQHGIGVGIMFLDLNENEKDKIREIIEAMAE